MHGPERLQKRIEALSTAISAKERLRTSLELSLPSTPVLGPFSPISFNVNNISLAKVHCVEEDYLNHAKSCFPFRIDICPVFRDQPVEERPTTSIQVP